MKKILLTFLFAIALFSYNTISPAIAADKMKIVYHVSELEKVPFVLGNMRNHIKGAGGPDKLDMVLVVHGPAGKAFHKTKSNPKVEQRVDNLGIDGVKFNKYPNEDNLSGAWLMSGSERRGEMRMREINRPRKTMKMLAGNRFQWIAYDTSKKGFYGTGGGTYTAIDGEYVENIEFFSRDSNTVGKSLEFNFEIKEGDWHHKGFSSKGDPKYEIWTKRKQ